MNRKPIPSCQGILNVHTHRFHYPSALQQPRNWVKVGQVTISSVSLKKSGHDQIELVRTVSEAACKGDLRPG